MRVFIIGATGFIGRHLVEQLKDDYELILLHRGNQPYPPRETIKSLIADRNHLPDLKSTIQEIKPDVVVDLIPYHAQHAWDVVNTFRQVSKRIIALSSGDVYRCYEVFKDNLKNITTEASNENSPLRQKLFPYRNLAFRESMLRDYDKILVESILKNQNEMETTILRLGAVYGPHDSQRKLKEYIWPMLNHENMILDKAKASWKWTRVYVKEVARAIRLVLAKPAASQNKIFNVGEPDALSQKQLVMELKEITYWKGKLDIIEGYSKEGYNYGQDVVLDTNKIRSQLEFVEAYNMQDGLMETIEFEKVKLGR